MKNPINCTLIFAVLLLCISCSTEEKANLKHQSASDGTARMTELLKSIEVNSNPLYNYHMNSARAAMMSQQLANISDIGQQAALKFQIANELLNAGKTLDAIARLKELRQQMEQVSSGITNQTKPIYEWLGIAYMRLGEQQNCIENHTSASCILPLAPEGQHKMTEGSENAIGYFSQVLEVFPNDLQVQWLLNIAYMTLGKYPGEVPAEWLIPEEVFQSSDNSLSIFKDIAIPLGIDVRGLSGGACMEDFNRDGMLDIFATSYGLSDQVRLFINTAKGFKDYTAEAGLTGIVSGLNTLHADYDNDGDDDILILRGAWLARGGNHPNSLLQNDGSGNFVDVTEQAGLLSMHPTQTAHWADFNLDGHLDLFIGNESTELHSSNPVVHPCELFMSNGDGTFTDRARELGLEITAYVKGVAVGDLNNDGLPDIYISILDQPNLLYLNQNKGRSFLEVGTQAGVNEPNYSFPCWIWDFDQDGWNDIFVSSYDAPRLQQVGFDAAAEYKSTTFGCETPRLYRNNQDGTFSEISEQAGLSRVMYSMGSNFGDLDQDGHLDFYVGTGAPDLRSIVPNRMFRNNGRGAFDEVTMHGFAHIQKGHGVAFGDIDNDGDQDIYCVMGGAFEGDLANNVLFENPGNDNEWIILELEGTKSNRSAIGARLRIEVETNEGNKRSIHRSISTGGSFGSNSLQLEIGLGKINRITGIEVEWPCSDLQVYQIEDINTKNSYMLKEGESAIQVIERPSIRFNRSGGKHDHHH